MMRKILLAAGLLMLSGCGAVAEHRIESALTDAGLSQPVSSCIAGRMVDKLSMAQLRSISRLKDKAGERPKQMSLPTFLLAHRSDLDPEVYSVLARAGVGCAIGA